MKEASGELSMTVVTIIAVIAVLVLWQVVGPRLTEWVNTKFNNLVNNTAMIVEESSELNF